MNDSPRFADLNIDAIATSRGIPDAAGRAAAPARSFSRVRLPAVADQICFAFGPHEERATRERVDFRFWVCDAEQQYIHTHPLLGETNAVLALSTRNSIAAISAVVHTWNFNAPDVEYALALLPGTRPLGREHLDQIIDRAITNGGRYAGADGAAVVCRVAAEIKQRLTLELPVGTAGFGAVVLAVRAAATTVDHAYATWSDLQITWAEGGLDGPVPEWAEEATSARPGAFPDALKRRLSEFFDEEFYLATYPDVHRAGISPIAHFMKFGWREGRSPNACFSAAFYGATCSPDDDPLLHFLSLPKDREPAIINSHLRSRLEETFDSAFYLKQNPDIAGYLSTKVDSAGIEVGALRHFVHFGSREYRDPNPTFRTDLYTKLFPEARHEHEGPYFQFLKLPEAERARRLSYLADWRGPTARAPRFNRYGAGNGVFVVVHDAQRSGAPLIALNLIRSLRQEYRLPVVTILLDAAGPLVAEFERESVELIAFNELLPSRSNSPALAWEEVARRLASRSITYGICNSVLGGKALEWLTGRGFRCVTLIHELPTSISGYGWERHAENAVSFAECVVFPSKVVHDSFVSRFGDPRGSTRILNQPSNIDHAAFDPQSAPDRRRRMRAALGLDSRDFVVLSAGYGDFRKGIDLYLQTVMAALERSRDSVNRLFFIWVGDVPDHVKVWVDNDIGAHGLAERVHLAGLQQAGMSEYYAAADLFFLPSREDPFPTVVIEALHAGLPVVGFEDSGGLAEQIGASAGRLVPYGNWSLAADALVELSTADLSEMRAAALMQASGFGTPECYAADLLNLLQFGQTQDERRQSRARTELVGVGLPTYNCAPFLEERIWSIFEQTIAPAEIYMVDDASPDASAEVLHRLKAFAPSPCRIEENADNSGTPFLQWQRCLEQLETPYAWIAESDDSARIRFLERLVGMLGKADDVRLAYANTATLDVHSHERKDGHDVHLSSVGPLRRWSRDFVRPGRDEVAELLAFENTIPNVSACIVDRKAALSALDKTPGFRTVGDWVFYLELLHDGSLAYCSEVLNLHRRHGTSVITRLEPEPIFHLERAAAHTRALRLGGLGTEAAQRMVERDNIEFGRLVGPVRAALGRSWLDVMQRRLLDTAAGTAPKGAKNVLVILPDLHVGGGQMYGLHLANALARQHYVWIYAVNPSHGDGDLTARLDAAIGVLPHMDLEHLVRFLQIAEIDLISSHVWWSDKLAYLLKSRRPETRWLMTMHGCCELILQRPDIDPWFADNVPELLQAADGVAYTADKNLTVFQRTGIAPDQAKVRKIYSGIPSPEKLARVVANKLEADHRPAKTFALVARGIEEKGWREAAEALREVNSRLAKDGREPIELVFAGKGEFLSELKRDERFAELPIRYAGIVDDVYALLAKADVGLLPSFFPQESLPNSVAEYLCSGVPAIVTDIGELPHMIDSADGPAGVVIGFTGGRADVDALAEAMYAYATDPAILRSHVLRTKAAARKFGLDAMIRSYSELVGVELLNL